jgi:predicted nucleotidyltransferase component of viral defense system
MAIKLREIQLEVLRIFSKESGSFALAGGTALELYYLKHRFSRDLDFFSQNFDDGEIVAILEAIKETFGYAPKFMEDSRRPGKVRYNFYTLRIKGTDESLKLDFVEDPLPFQPVIKNFDGVPVYDVKRIYFQKLAAITGVAPGVDKAGQVIPLGRNEPRDVIDLYYLSKKIEPLNLFLKATPRSYQLALINWRKNFSAADFKQAYLTDYRGAMYDKKLEPRAIVQHVDEEINLFMQGELA